MNEKELMERYGAFRQDKGKPDTNSGVVHDDKPIIKFNHNCQIVVSNGFYKGYTGTVKDYMIDKDKTIFYKVEINEMDNAEVIFKQDDLSRTRKKLFGIF